MKKYRNCATSSLFTGTSGCEIDHSKIKAAILVKHGISVGTSIESAEKTRGLFATEGIYGIKTFCEYAKNGGEPNTGTVGYGPEKINGYSAMQDQFTMEDYSEALVANIVSAGNSAFDVYYVDEDNNLYFYDDGTENHPGFPLSYVSVNPTPYSSSGSQAQAVINFAHKDTKKSLMHTNYIHLDYDVLENIIPLMSVDIVKVAENKYKIVESVGGYDVTALFGATSKNLTEILTGASNANYINVENVISVSSWTTPGLADVSTLFEAGIFGYKWSGRYTA